MAVKCVALALCVSVFFFGRPALAEDSLAGFGNVTGAQPTPPVQKPTAPRKKVKAPSKEAASPTAQLSIATVAPGLLPYFVRALFVCSFELR